MSEVLVQHVQFMFMGGINMSDVTNWQGYLIKSQGNNHLICSPWILDGSCVFGHDSDYTTLAISLLRYLSIDFESYNTDQY